MFLLGVDIGTSSTKSVIFDCDGNLISQASSPYVFETTQSGYAEQDPDEWWKAVATSIRESVAAAGIDGKELAGIGLSGQMHGLVGLDCDGVPVRKAILHCDVRAGAEAEKIVASFGSVYSQIVYNPVFPGMQAISLYWVKKHEPENYRKIKYVICPKDYVRYKLTGNIGTEHTDASGTLFYDMKNCCWSEDVLSLLGLEREKLPEAIHGSCEIAGVVSKQAAMLCGIAPGTPVVYGGGDQAMHSIGNNIMRTGATMATIGTSGQVLRIVEQPKYNSKLNTHIFRHVEDQKWFGLGAVLSAGCTLSWFQRNFCEGATFQDLSMMAQGVPCGSNGLMFLPTMQGERTPYLDSSARGIFFGLNMMHTRAHFARAIMEGVCFAMKSAIDEIEALFGQDDVLICAGGGVKGQTWAQIQANIYNREIYVSTISEQACLGAAITAGVGTKVFQSIEDGCGKMCRNGRLLYLPQPEQAALYESLYRDVYKKLYSRNQEIFCVAKNYINC